jgi:NAD(P)-dependent dehydrogenase (short-subunit alcohol dehydrogenase family)
MTERRVLITGAGSGIGRACALHLAGRGWTVLAAGRTPASLQAVAKEAEGKVLPLVLDVTDEASVAEAIGKAGAIDALVNNAGVSVMGPVEGVPLSEWRRQFEVNVYGAATMIRAVLPRMREAGRGRIVNMGSVTGRLVPPFMGAYGASKHALEGLTDALRREVSRFGIEVTLVRPGFVNTPFGDQEQESLRANAHPAYEGPLSRFTAWHEEEGHAASPSPVVVAQAVERALTDSPARSRYHAPARAGRLVALREALPARLVDRMIARTTRTGSKDGDRRSHPHRNGA